MPLLRASQIHYQVGSQILLDDAELQLKRGERVCLLGRNGAGKSTLLSIIEGSLAADSGEVWRRPEITIARMEQALPTVEEGVTVFDAVAGGLAELGELLRRYHALVVREGAAVGELEQLQHEIEARDGWRFQQRIESILSRLQLDGERQLAQLSGGWLRRVSLARALVREPDLLLLDEPTNHLDVESIEWLENQLLDFSGCLLFISHDRALIERLATRIVELDRGQLISHETNYRDFLERREHQLAVEAEHNAKFDKRLAEEERWIRQGIKARRTRNEGRVRALKQMRQERAERRQRQGNASMSVNVGQASGKLVAELEGVNYAVGGQRLVKELSLIVSRGDRIGLVGPNGIGKTTLLRLLLGELEADSGHIKRGTRLQVAYFDQMRNRLDEEQTVVDIVGQGRQSISINGRDRHIVSYLADFLFSPERARSQFRVLSGGERARVQLACLFSQPANILVLDEPTNDLDIETLELLEELLLGFDGTVLLVSHDRAFLDSVVTSCLLFEGGGVINEYVGGYSDIAGQRAPREAQAVAAEPKKSESAPARPSRERQKLSYKLQRELEQLPAAIETLEQQVAAVQAEVGDAGFYERDHEAVATTLERLAQLQQQLEQHIERWVELSDQ